ncbi:complex I 24 kDa subunit family protein [Kiritimatiella glycovorans]
MEGGSVSEKQETERVLTPELRGYAEEWAERPGSLIMVLHKVQEHFGYIPRQAAFEVAELLSVPPARVFGVITFYHLFKLQEPGRNRIAVCMGTACYLKGAEDLITELEQLLGVGLNTVTPDGEFSVEAVRCIGCCGLAPVLTVNGHVHGNLTPEDLPDILAQYRGA